jgi:hypothetical protein
MPWINSRIIAGKRADPIQDVSKAVTLLALRGLYGSTAPKCYRTQTHAIALGERLWCRSPRE